MAKTVIDLRRAIAAHMHRDPTSFVQEGMDCLMLAINNAKDFSQRAVDFEYAKIFAQLTGVSATDGGDLANATLFGTATAVRIKALKRAFVGTVAAGGYLPIDFIDRDAYTRSLQKKLEGYKPTDNPNSFLSVLTSNYGIVQYGTKIYIVPNSAQALGGSTVNLYFDAIQWLDDFGKILTGVQVTAATNKLIHASATFVTSGVVVGHKVRNMSTGTTALVTAVDSETQLSLAANIFSSTNETYEVETGIASSFLLEYAFDYLLFRSIVELNFFLKEEERFSISANVLDATWKNVYQWNASIVGSNVDSTNLD